MSTKVVSSIINVGTSYEYVDNGEPMRGGMKDVYFSPDKTYVVAFYRSKLDFNAKERLRLIVTRYKMISLAGKAVISGKRSIAGLTMW